MSHPVTREQAEQTLAAVRAQFKTYLEPMHFEAFTDDETGKTYPAHTMEPVCPEPTLVENYTGSGHWAIVWEDGPDDWAYRASVGGTSEAERVMMADAAAEFGVDPQAAVDRMKADEPVRAPAGVEVEPYMSFVLSIYPA